MKYIELKQHISKVLSGDGSFSPMYLVYGDDDCLSRKALKMFENLVSPDFCDFNLVKVASEEDMGVAIDALYTFPVFDEYKVVILSLQTALKKAKKKFESEDNSQDADSPVKKAIDEYMASPNPTSIFVIACESKEVAITIKYKNAQSVDCNRLDDDALTEEIKQIAEQSPKRRIEPLAIKELILRTQSSMGRVESEMSKLKAYTQDVISKQDVCDMVVADTDFKMFELANAVSQKNCDDALSILSKFFENGFRGVTILSLLYGKYREMLHVQLNKNLSNDELAKLLGFSKGGMVYYLKQTAGNYSQVRLKKCVDYLHNLQYDVLQGKRNEMSAVHEAILTLLSI